MLAAISSLQIHQVAQLFKYKITNKNVKIGMQENTWELMGVSSILES